MLSVARIEAMSAEPDFDCTSSSVPPLKSMPKFSPWVKNRMIATIESAAEIGNEMRRKRVKSKCVSSGTMRSGGSRSSTATTVSTAIRMPSPMRTNCVKAGSPSQIGTVFGRFHRTQPATIRLVRVKAVNTVVMMPMPSVTAKPRTGPVPI